MSGLRQRIVSSLDREVAKALLELSRDEEAASRTSRRRSARKAPPTPSVAELPEDAQSTVPRQTQHRDAVARMKEASISSPAVVKTAGPPSGTAPDSGTAPNTDTHDPYEALLKSVPKRLRGLPPVILQSPYALQVRVRRMTPIKRSALRTRIISSVQQLAQTPISEDLLKVAIQRAQTLVDVIDKKHPGSATSAPTARGGAETSGRSSLTSRTFIYPARGRTVRGGLPGLGRDR